MLTYIGETIVNGNKEVAGKAKPTGMRPAPIPEYEATTPPEGTRQLLDRLGAEGFAKWTREQTRLLLTDTTFRDAHQSLFATRMRSHDMLAIARFVSHRLHNLYSLEMWGGATFDVALAFPARGPVGKTAAPARSDSEHLLSDAAPRLQRRRLHRVSR